MEQIESFLLDKIGEKALVNDILDEYYIDKHKKKMFCVFDEMDNKVNEKDIWYEYNVGEFADWHADKTHSFDFCNEFISDNFDTGIVISLCKEYFREFGIFKFVCEIYENNFED